MRTLPKGSGQLSCEIQEIQGTPAAAPTLPSAPFWGKHPGKIQTPKNGQKKGSKTMLEMIPAKF